MTRELTNREMRLEFKAFGEVATVISINDAVLDILTYMQEWLL
jgi:hypothetical protein